MTCSGSRTGGTSMDSKPLYTKIMVPSGQQCHLEPQEESLTWEVSQPKVCYVRARVAQATPYIPSMAPAVLCPHCPACPRLCGPGPCLPQHQAELSWKCKGCWDTSLSLVLTWGAGWRGLVVFPILSFKG